NSRMQRNDPLGTQCAMISHRRYFGGRRRPGARDIPSYQGSITADGKNDLGQLLADAYDPQPPILGGLRGLLAVAATRKKHYQQQKIISVHTVVFGSKDISQLCPPIKGGIVGHRQKMRI